MSLCVIKLELIPSDEVIVLVFAIFSILGIGRGVKSFLRCRYNFLNSFRLEAGRCVIFGHLSIAESGGIS